MGNFYYGPTCLPCTGRDGCADDKLWKCQYRNDFNIWPLENIVCYIPPSPLPFHLLEIIYFWNHAYADKLLEIDHVHLYRQIHLYFPYSFFLKIIACYYGLLMLRSDCVWFPSNLCAVRHIFVTPAVARWDTYIRFSVCMSFYSFTTKLLLQPSFINSHKLKGLQSSDLSKGIILGWSLVLHLHVLVTLMYISCSVDMWV